MHMESHKSHVPNPQPESILNAIDFYNLHTLVINRGWKIPEQNTEKTERSGPFQPLVYDYPLVMTNG